jgi:glycosyltransferase involved in cell wall biosynthesis
VPRQRDDAPAVGEDRLHPVRVCEVEKIVSSLVSVLVPVYNRELHIEACIRSALTQTASHLEVVVVDNRSTDGTWEICQSLASQDNRIRLLRNNTNIGPVKNWQRCIEEARGELGKILFSDDLMLPSFLEKTVPFLDNPEVGLVTSAADVSGHIEYVWQAGIVPSRRYLWDSMFNGRLPVSPGAALLRMRDLRKNLHDFGSHGIGPDLLLMMLTASSYPRAAHVPEPLVFFRDHVDSLSRRNQATLSRGYARARARFVLSRIARRFSFASTMHT